MAYGLKYQSQFDSQSDVIAGEPSKQFTLQFLFKDYTGPVAAVMGAATLCIQRCTVDKPTDPIKGQSLDITLVNLGNIPISSFQSEDDDGVQVILLDELGGVRFIGYLVQDDFYEGMVDYAHPITLSANDSLGLLKGVPLDEAPVYYDLLFTSPVEPLETTAPNTIITSFAFGSTILIGDKLRISGTAVDGDYTIATANLSGTDYIFTTIETIGTQAATTASLSVLRANDNFRVTLLSIIRRCLGVTNLSLLTNIFLNYYAFQQDQTRSTFEQTILDTQLFISGETYEDCYSVLTKILTAFNCTLFQANGQWNIVNFYESRRYAGNAIPGFVYDEDMLFLSNTVLGPLFNIGPDPQLTRPIHELTQGSLRGYKFTRRVFDYNQPKYLLSNYDLQTLGALIRTYTSGGFTYNEYVAPGWTQGFGATLCERFIRVILDGAGNETERYLVCRGASTDTIRAVQAEVIEFSAGDKLNFSFSTRTNISQAGPSVLVFAVMLTDGTLNRFVDELPVDNGDWIPTVGFSYNLAGNTNVWNNVEIKSSQAPYSGLLYLYLAQNTATPQNSSRETHYKDIRLQVTQFINDTSKIIGQIHKHTQTANKKNNSDIEIQVDDSPRNTIVGTLFLQTFTGLLQDRTTFWRHPTEGIFGWRLGQLTTLDELTWRQRTRAKFEGGFVGMWQGGYVSMLSMVVATFNTNKNYTFGLLTIDYKRNQFNGTLWEMHDITDPVFAPDYLFSFIYSTT